MAMQSFRQRLETKQGIGIVIALLSGGVLVYIVPEYILHGNRSVLRHLAGWYQDVRVFQFTPDEYEAFRQVALIGVKREAYHHPKDAEVAALAGIPSPPLRRAQGWLLRTGPASVLGPPTEGACPEVDGVSGAERAVYIIPEAPKVATGAFYYTPTTGEDYARAIAWEGISVPNLVCGEAREQDFRPVMPLKKGHLAMLLSAGLAGQMALTAEDGMPLLVRGRVIKDVRYTSKAQMDVGDERPGDEVVVVQQDVLRTVIAVASPNGVRKIADTAELRDFVKMHARQMADLILARHRPLYSFDALPVEWQAMTHLSRHRYLPGRAETGLMKAQKHVTVALARLLREHIAPPVSPAHQFPAATGTVALVARGPEARSAPGPPAKPGENAHRGRVLHLRASCRGSEGPSPGRR